MIAGGLRGSSHAAAFQSGSALRLPSITIRGYGGRMTDGSATPEPANYELMAAIQSLATGQQALAEAMTASFAHLATEISGVKADVAGLRSDLIATEARLTSRIGDVQAVVQNVKADLAAHDADGHGQPNAG